MITNATMYRDTLNKFYKTVLERAYDMELPDNAVNEISGAIGRKIAEHKSFGNHSVYVLSKILVHEGDLALTIREALPAELPEGVDWGYVLMVFDRAFSIGSYGTGSKDKVGLQIWDSFGNMIKIVLKTA